MANYKKFCSECFLPVPPGWNERYCPSCGGRIKLRIVKKRKASQAHPRNEPQPETDKTAEKPRGLRLSRKKTRPEPAGIFSAREKSVLGPRFLTMSPVMIFALNIFSMGLRSAFWLINRMPSILMTAKPEEKNIKFPVILWLASYFASFALIAAGAFEFAVWRANPVGMLQSRVFQGMAAAWSLSFLLNRYLLYWSREAIIDELLRSRFDTVRSRAAAFAPSSLMIWFFGIPYIQAHINRMIKKKGLKSYKPHCVIKNSTEK